MRRFSNFAVPGRCERPEWGISDASPTIHQKRHISSFHSCMILITITSTIAVLLKELDVITNFFASSKDDCSAKNFKSPSQSFNDVDSRSDVISHNSCSYMQTGIRSYASKDFIRNQKSTSIVPFN